MAVTEPHHRIVVQTTAIQVAIKKTIAHDLMTGIDEATTKHKVKTLVMDFAKTAETKNKRLIGVLVNGLSLAFANWYIGTRRKMARVAQATAVEEVLTVESDKITAPAKAKAQPEKVSEALTLKKGEYKITDEAVKQIAQKAMATAKIVERGRPPERKVGYNVRPATLVKKRQRALQKILADLARSDGLIEKGLSLRNSAEIEARHQVQTEKIEELRSKGTRIVWCSSHSDCSRRCEPWQGKLYSLDGTSGTVDGLSYQPLEIATDIYETTRTGKVWKNGLLGFNCRHYLTPYKANSRPPTEYSAALIKKQRAIDQKQRVMENAIRKKRTIAEVLAVADIVTATKIRDDAEELTTDYRHFCALNDRPFYGERTQIMTEDIAELERRLNKRSAE